MSIHYTIIYYFLLTASFNAFPALKAGTVAAAILISSPVCGFLPFLAALFLASKEPNPTNWTLSPFFNVASTTSTKAFNVSYVAFLVAPVFFAKASTNSDLFIYNSSSKKYFLSFVYLLI